MQTVMWNKRRIIIIIVISIFAYFLLRKKQYAYNEEFVLKNVRAETVWEFLADFSNNKKHLIPHMWANTILLLFLSFISHYNILNFNFRDSFSITSESGNYDNWKYSVVFDETYLFWPYLKSRTVGHYSIKANGDKYLISSVHDVCFMYGLACCKLQQTRIIIKTQE